MTSTLPIQAVSAVLRIAALPGMHVVHAPADENADASVLLCLLEAVDLGWTHAFNEPLWRLIRGYDAPPIAHARNPERALAGIGQRRVEAGEEGEEGVRNFKLTFSGIENHVDGEYAWAVCDVEAEAWLPEQEGPIRGSGRETFIFHRERKRWKAVYVHGSLRPEKGH